MLETLGWIVVFVFVLEAICVIDVNVDIRWHGDGETILHTQLKAG